MEIALLIYVIIFAGFMVMFMFKDKQSEQDSVNSSLSTEQYRNTPQPKADATVTVKWDSSLRTYAYSNSTTQKTSYPDRNDYKSTWYISEETKAEADRIIRAERFANMVHFSIVRGFEEPLFRSVLKIKLGEIGKYSKEWGNAFGEICLLDTIPYLCPESKDSLKFVYPDFPCPYSQLLQFCKQLDNERQRKIAEEEKEFEGVPPDSEQYQEIMKKRQERFLLESAEEDDLKRTYEKYSCEPFITSKTIEEACNIIKTTDYYVKGKYWNIYFSDVVAQYRALPWIRVEVRELLAEIGGYSKDLNDTVGEYLLMLSIRRGIPESFDALKAVYPVFPCPYSQLVQFCKQLHEEKQTIKTP